MKVEGECLRCAWLSFGHERVEMFTSTYSGDDCVGNPLNNIAFGCCHSLEVCMGRALCEHMFDLLGLFRMICGFEASFDTLACSCIGNHD